MNDAAQGIPVQNHTVDQARRRLLIVVLALMMGLLLLSTTELTEPVDDDSGKGGGEANGGGDDGPTTDLKRVAAEIASLARGPLYPKAVNASGLSPPASNPFTRGKGSMQIHLMTVPANNKVPSLLRTEGIMSLYDGDTENAPLKMQLPLSGLYVADEGLLLISGTPRMTAVQLYRPSDNARLLQTDDSSPNADAAPARFLQAGGDPSGNNSTVPDDDDNGGGDGGICDMFMALRFKPIGFDHVEDSSDGAKSRRLTGADIFSVYEGAQYVVVGGRMVSPNCNFTMNVTASAAVVDLSAVAGKQVSYAALAALSALSLILLNVYQITRSGSQSAAARVSMATIGLQALMDAYMTLIHMIISMTQYVLFSSFAAAAFVQMLLFSVLEMRYMLIIWKARRQDTFNSGWEAVRRQVGALYCKFYLVLIAGMVLMYLGQLGAVKFILLVCLSFWLPQIVHSAQNDCRPGLTRAYVIGTSVCRLLVPLYFLACPVNLLYMIIPPESRYKATHSLDWKKMSLLQPWTVSDSIRDAVNSMERGYPAVGSAATSELYWQNAKFGIFLTVWVAFQCVVLLLQGKPGWGPRFFVPAVFLPQKYSYHRPVRIAEDRVLPDPTATQPWLRERADNDAAEEGADATAAGAATPALQRLANSVRRSASRTVSNTVWFMSGMRVFVADVASRSVARVGSLFSRSQANRRQYSPIDAGNTATATQAPEDAEGATVDPESGGAVPDNELDQMVPVDLVGSASIDCVICMEPIHFPCRRRDYMVTPCDHIFHPACLTPWMEQKLECPTCRLQLPEP